jgi:hypothetical protein
MAEFEWTISGIWSQAWAGVKRGWRGLLAVFGLLLVATLLSEGFTEAVSEPMNAFVAGPLRLFSGITFPYVMDFVGSVLISTLVFPLTAIPLGFATVGVTKVSLDIVRGRPFSWSRLLSHEFTEWMYTVGALVLVYFLTLLSFLLFVVPGLIFVLAAPMTIFVVVDQETDPVSALLESFRLMRGEKVFYSYLLLSISLAMLAGILACFVGIIPVLFTTVLLKPVFYEGLVARKGRMSKENKPDLS